jgi:hypothetical protein
MECKVPRRIVLSMASPNPFQMVQESEELLAAMARQATADNPAIEDIESGKQGRGPLPYVVMRLAFRKSRPPGRMGAVWSGA